MTPEELFDEAVAFMRRDRAELVRFLEGVSEAQARWKPPDGEWSILEGLEHITLSDAHFAEMLLKTIREAERTGRWDNAPPHPKKMSYEALRRREQGYVEAPERSRPKGAADFAEMRGGLIAAREAAIEALSPYRSSDMRRLLISHPRYGERNIYDVMTYAGIHDYLHNEQMERVTRQPGYPAPG